MANKKENALRGVGGAACVSSPEGEPLTGSASGTGGTGCTNGSVKPPIVFYAFDLLRLNGKDLRNLRIEERKAKLEELLKKPPWVIRYSISFTKDIPELLDRAQKLGLEGLIGKRSGSRYEAGKRTGAWFKIKLHLEQELVIGGYNRAGRSRKFLGCPRLHVQHIAFFH